MFFDLEKEKDPRNEFSQPISLFDTIFESSSQINFEQNFLNSNVNDTMNTPPFDMSALNDSTDNLFRIGSSLLPASDTDEVEKKKDS